MYKSNQVFARKNYQGNFLICDKQYGDCVSRLDASVYPVGSGFSTRYEHPEGIILAEKDVLELNIEIE